MLEGALTPGTLVAFLLYAVTIAGAVMSLAGFWGNLQEASGAAQRIFELMDHSPELPEPTAPTHLALPVRGEIAYEGVTFRYGRKLPLVLEGIDVRISQGERVALVGSSGAGKTTMASLIPRFYDVSDGQVTVDGVDVRRPGPRGASKPRWHRPPGAHAFCRDGSGESGVRQTGSDRA